MKWNAFITCRWATATVVVWFWGMPDLYKASGQATTASKQSEEAGIPVLTTAEQVHRLTREEASGGHKALIRGVITCTLPQFEAVVIQDSTRGVYVSHLDSSQGEPPGMAELVEIEGVTDPGEFAPHIRAGRMRRLAVGVLPQPVHSSWDQLINGSLDTQYVEIEGIITTARADQVTLLTHGGRITATLAGTNLDTLTKYENALVRVRGCLFATWDAATHRVKVGEIRVFSASITVEEPAPEDVFAIGLKRAAELLLFDPQASALMRVMVSGQIVHER